MNKKILLILLFCIALSANAPAEEEKCVPTYDCTDWSECSNGLRTRTCEDITCGGKRILERTFCDNPDCTPNIECEWGPCIYTEKTNSLIRGEIGFGGYSTGVCRDANKCIPSFTQERSCEESYALQLSPIEECSENILAVIDPASDRKIAKISLDAWKENRFDISFVQGERQYCPSCFNAVKDDNEQGIDCGGSCEPCKTERRYVFYFALIFLWLGSLVFSFLSLREAIQLKKPKQIFIEQ